MAKINEYLILNCPGTQELQEKVIEKIHDGWKIVGCVVIDPPTQQCATYYMQTMER